MPTRSVDNMEGSKSFKDLDITKDEADRIAKAFENEEFRKLFKEYAEEISNPENRKRYEEEIAVLEGERGMDVKFVNPDPGYVIKTSQDGDKKVFINICKNDHIAKPTSSREKDNGRSGLAWQIPHSFAPPREDIDKGHNKCMVYDVVFNPDTYRMAETNVHFKKLIQDTALDGIENQFGVKLDKKNLKFPKLQFKGVARPTVIRSKKAEGTKDIDPDDPLSKMPYPYDDAPSGVKAENNEEKNKNKVNAAKNKEAIIKENNDEYTRPKFTIIHRNEVDFQDYTNSGPTNTSTCPKELVVSIDLPLLTSSRNVSLDIFERKLGLQSEKPAKYKLDLDLPYTVNEENGSAKFDKAKRKLVVTLPVVKPVKDFHESQESNETSGIHENGVLDEGTIMPNDMEAKPVIEVLPDPEKDTHCLTDSSELVNSSNSNNGSCDGDVNICRTQDEITVDLTAEIDEEASDKVVDASSLTDDAKNAEKVYYAAPPYDIHQDETTISIIIKVSNVQEDSLSKTYPGEPGASFGLKFVSIGMGGFPMHYSFLLGVPEGHLFKAAGSHVDVDETIVVMLLTKDKASLGMWDKIFIGKDEDTLLEKYFVTDKTLRRELDDLEAAAAMPAPDSSPDLLVTDMNENKLAITIKNNDDCTSPPESPPELCPDVELMQEQKLGSKLHSILKQRSPTMSESSDEVFTYSRENSVCLAGSESPISESEEGGDGEPGRRVRTKSVSFSEKVDQQTFKQNQPTTTLRNTLKNKRKNQRKAERKQGKEEKGNRRNRNSDSISEMSSDGEGSSTHDDVSSNHELEDNDNGASDENDNAVDNKGDNINDTTTTVIADANGNITSPNVNTTTNGVLSNQEKNKKNSRRKNRRNKNQAYKGDEVASDGHQPPETSSPSSQSGEDGEWRGVDAHECCDSEKVVPKKKLVEIVKDDGHDSDDNGDEYDDDSPEDGERTSDKNDTILNWEEKKAAVDRAPCPVSFTNSVMFDLD